jgi:hypothetical protein
MPENKSEYIDRKKINRRLITLGRLILDIQRERAGATFDPALYPDNHALKRLGLSAIGEINKPEILEILHVAAKRDHGIRRLINDILNNLSMKAAEIKAQEGNLQDDTST